MKDNTVPYQKINIQLSIEEFLGTFKHDQLMQNYKRMFPKSMTTLERYSDYCYKT